MVMHTTYAENGEDGTIARVTPDTSRRFVFAGVMFIAIVVFLGYSVWRG